MIVSRSRTMHPQSPSLTIVGTVQESDDLYIILGVTFDSKMTFVKRLYSVSSADSQRLGIFWTSWQAFHDTRQGAPFNQSINSIRSDKRMPVPPRESLIYPRQKMWCPEEGHVIKELLLKKGVWVRHVTLNVTSSHGPGVNTFYYLWRGSYFLYMHVNTPSTLIHQSMSNTFRLYYLYL